MVPRVGRLYAVREPLWFTVESDTDFFVDIDGILQMIIKSALPFLLVFLVSFEPDFGKTFFVPMFV